ncbi:chorismate-pyruvate lyase [Mycobacterium tuberculosis]|nr:chorismate-pyruvate lyase [Mycobacterium tuberculosis]
MTECFLSDQEIRKLNRDLRILIAANGTLTRVLNIVADDEVIVQIVKQRIHDVSPKLSEFEQLGQVGVGRVLQRYIILKGRNSEHLFVAAESLIAIDRLPAAIITRLTQKTILSARLWQAATSRPSRKRLKSGSEICQVGSRSTGIRIPEREPLPAVIALFPEASRSWW